MVFSLYLTFGDTIQYRPFLRIDAAFGELILESYVDSEWHPSGIWRWSEPEIFPVQSRGIVFLWDCFMSREHPRYNMPGLMVGSLV